MLRSFFVAIALAVGVGGEGAAPPADKVPTPAPEGVLGILWEEAGIGGELVRMDSLTLEPLGPSLELASGNAATDFSPDYRRLALAYPDPAKVEIVDVRRMKSLGAVDLGINGWISFLSWDRGYLFAVVDGESDRAVLTIDPVRRRVQARHPVSGTILQVRRGVAQQVVLLLAPRDGIGPLQFAVVGGKGMTITPIPGFTGGWEADQEGDVVRTRQKVPALVVDEVGERALVVSGRAVAEISLNDLAVREHTLSEPVSLLGRLRNWLEPAAHAKLVDGPWRSGTWIGDGLFTISGEDYSSEGGQHHHGEPAGISIVDTRDWSVRTIDDDSVEVVATENAIVGHGGYQFGGVIGYDARGEKLFELLPNSSVWLQVVGGFVYAVHESSKRFTIIDPRLGRIVGTAKTEDPLTLVEG